MAEESEAIASSCSQQALGAADNARKSTMAGPGMQDFSRLLRMLSYVIGALIDHGMLKEADLEKLVSLADAFGNNLTSASSFINEAILLCLQEEATEDASDLAIKCKELTGRCSVFRAHAIARNFAKVLPFSCSPLSSCRAG